MFGKLQTVIKYELSRSFTSKMGRFGSLTVKASCFVWTKFLFSQSVWYDK